ncbi:hypothetical protein [Salinimicrobium oceani]|uniref:NnrS protein n=1 Tax=Salinimicrobium oceani TaxID=2722702 RepID=A0ABX1CVQ6_9FLAO|nr:hypothetical protein [Salinimicrobium oceani]NJW52375.1 hypothetical protein [Salinimicrobium oceani]
MIQLKNHTNVALGYFFLVGLLGALLRFFFVVPIPANFRHLVHAHSHIALLGWVYIGLSTLIYCMYFSKAAVEKVYQRIFWFTQVCLIGMLLTFPFTGYAFLSITFSTLFLIASYSLTWFFLKKIPAAHRKKNSFQLIRASLFFMVLSSIGPWVLGPIVVTSGSASIWYKLAIYFYLHFQYNAWFILALCGILFFILEEVNLVPQKRQFWSFFWQINAAVILSFFLSVLWTAPHWSFYLLGAMGAVLQVSSFLKLYHILSPLWKSFPLKPFFKLLLKLCGLLLIVKILLQALSAVPFFADLVFNFPDLVIGYLHWVFLGVVSIPLFIFLSRFNLLQFPKGIFWIYFGAFIMTEVLIFYKGIVSYLELPLFPTYFKVLAYSSLLLPLTVGILFFNNFLKNPKTSPKGTEV